VVALPHTSASVPGLAAGPTPGRYSTTATSSISTIASGWARRLISIVVLVGVATPR